MSYWDQRAETVGGRVATFDGIDWTTGTQAMVDLILPWLPDSGTVADLGCGIGRMTVPLAEARPDLDFVGVDASAAMLAQVLDAPDNVTFVHADVTSLPFDEIDGAFSVLVVQHLNPVQVAVMLNGIRRTLVPDGRFVCQWVWGDHHAPQDHRYDLVEVDRAAAPLKFVETFEGVHPDWQWGVWET